MMSFEKPDLVIDSLTVVSHVTPLMSPICTGCERTFKSTKSLLIHRRTCQRYEDALESLSIVQFKRTAASELSDVLPKWARLVTTLENELPVSFFFKEQTDHAYNIFLDKCISGY